MKNYLIKQAKKSFSLALALLMLMSCWVWVAPEKAEAGADTGTYPVTFKFNITNQSEGSNKCLLRFVVTYVTNNGTGSTSSATYQLDGSDSRLKDESKQHEWTVDVPGYPTQVAFNIRDTYFQGFGACWNDLLINGVDVWDEQFTRENSGGLNENWADEATVTTSSAGVTDKWVKPYLNSATATLSPTSHTLAKINSGTNSTSTISLSDFKDNYNVKWIASTTPSFTLRVDEGVTLGSNATLSGSGNSRTINIKPWFQTLYPGKQNAKLYIDWSVTGGTGTVGIKTETIIVDFPTYKATFHANGGKIGVDDTEAKDSIEYTGEKMNIGSVIGKAPAYATKTGFEFKGFYSTQYADATGKTASFDESKKFVDDETIIPAATSGNGDTNWYAAWQALPITATFLTQDGQLIGTVEGRYNNYLTASNMYGDAGLNAAVKASHTAGKVKFNTNNEPIYTDGATSFKFAGWKIIKAYDESVMDKNEDTVLQGDVTFQAVYTKADAQTYTVKFKDAAGAVISEKSGYAYRADVTNIPATEPTLAQDDKYSYDFIGWAKDIGKNFYTVDANNQDENGATIAYTHKDGAEFIVKGDASYVPVFRMVPREYKVTYNYTVDGGTAESTVIEGYHWEEAPRMPEIKDNYTADGNRYFLTGWKVNNKGAEMQLNEISIKGDTSITAVYGRSEAAKYTINFYGKDEDGVTDKLLNADTNIYEHDSDVKAPEVPQTIDTAEALYTFAGWSPAVAAKATGDADYYATYTKQTYADLQFYNYDETLIYETLGKENKLYVGDIIPDYVGETPVKPEDPTGIYTFTGWNTKPDGSGKTVRPGTDMLEGDTKLYAQFATTYKEYTVKFLKDDGTVISEKKYKYLEDVTVPEKPEKAADVEYSYEFKSWSPEVATVCLGDATYTATYRRTPIYYTVTWLKDNKTVHSTANYIYNARINQGIINAPVDYPNAGTGKTWAFKHWVQCDENGNDILDDGKQVIFQRGQRMPSEDIYFYPVFEEVDNVLTVTFYKEDGVTELGKAAIPYGQNIGDYDDTFKAKAPKLPDDNYHYVIDNWVNVDGGATVTTVNADVSVKATYTAEAHNRVLYETVVEPTYNLVGYANFKCEAEECTKIEYNREISVLDDSVIPTGKLYVGSATWLSEDKDSIDYSEITYVSPKTQLIVNANDAHRGVAKIEYYVADKVVTDSSTITKWTEIYNVDGIKGELFEAVLDEHKLTEDKYNALSVIDKAAIDREVELALSTYRANATGIISNLNLDEGEDYVIYIRITDRAPYDLTANTEIFSSGTISYGSKAAEIEITGEGYGTKFCDEALIRIIDDADGLQAVELDGKAVEAYTNPGTTSANGTFVASFKTAAEGVHTVTVIDKHGNKTVKTFEIKGDHTYRNYTTAATCENDGSRYDLCTVCGHKANEVVLPKLGHSYTLKYTEKAPTCVDDGSRTYVCDNNCGVNLTVTPDEDGAPVYKPATEKAYTYNEETKAFDIELDAEDIKHLKATGVHTYAKVKDENGNDTAEDAWVIDKAATCQTDGAKHKDCIKCGQRTNDTIEKSDEFHKFYRDRVTTEPTCTAMGEKTKTCRYCGKSVHVADIPALGHIEGEYRIVKAATCEEAGSKILTCGRCSTDENPVDIGEPIKDNDGTITGFDGKAVEIAAIGHAYKAEGEIFLGEDGKYYQKYVCKNDKTHVENRVVEGYQPPVAAAVTFKNGKDALQTINGFVGETISAAEITATPTKAADATYTYTFSHWADEKGNAVKFPIEVKGDATYTAVFAERYINYTITYYKEDGVTEFKKVGYLHNDQKVKLADGPAKAETNKEKYTFKGWVLKDSEDKTAYNELTINGANISLVASYTTAKKNYAVTYAYSREDIIHTYTVKAGDPAPNVVTDFGDVTKASTATAHYVFTGWNKQNDLKEVVNNIYTTPNFKAEDHDYTEAAGGSKTLITPATCTSNEVYEYECACGYKETKETPNTALGHEWGEAKYDAATGKTTETCQREGCGATRENASTYTVKFFVNADDAKHIDILNYVAWGSTLPRIPLDPSKEMTSTTEYKFVGWYDKTDASKTIVDLTKLEVKQNYDFVAKFEEITREYTVIFAYDAYRVIKKYEKVTAGSNVVYDGATPVKAPDVNGHYEFNGWSGSTSNIQGDVYVTAKFIKKDHTYNTSQLNEATCTNGKGTRFWCNCNGNVDANGNPVFDNKAGDAYVDFFYDETGKPLAHDFAVEKRVEATPEADGYIIYKCNNCTETKTETLKYSDDKISIQVKVTHNGAAQSGVRVQILERSATATPVFVTTNADGIANATGVKGVEYVAYVTINGDEIEVRLTADANGNLSATYNYTDKADCSCACHRNNIWGSIFRFFHKIIKLFTGEFKCCGNPDPMYG